MSRVYEGHVIITSSEAVTPFLRQQVGFLPGNAFVSLESANVRYRYGGAVPSDVDGHLFYADTSLNFGSSVDIEKITFIATGSNAVLQFTVKGR